MILISIIEKKKKSRKNKIMVVLCKNYKITTLLIKVKTRRHSFICNELKFKEKVKQIRIYKLE